MPAPISIVDNVLPIAELEVENISGLNIPNTQHGIMEWCARRGLIKNRLRCHACDIFMSLNAHKGCLDGYRWKCNNCSARKSIRDGSFFWQSKLTLYTAIKVIYYWCRDTPQQEIIHEVGLGPRSTHTLVDYASYCREVCGRDLAANPPVIGGLNEETLDPLVVEIDESKFFHRKYQRGRLVDGQWVFSGVERGSGKCFLLAVENRSMETLHAAIQRYILPGSRIISDGWRGYNGLADIRDGIYTHDRVIHEQNFVDPYDRAIHTQTIENLWMRAKRKLKRQFGTSQQQFPTYLNEFMWRNNNRVHKDLVCGNFLSCLRRQFEV